MLADSERHDNIMIDQTRTLNYNFSHIALPVIALWNGRKFYKTAFKGHAKSYLEGIYQGISAKMGGPKQHADIEIRRAELKGNVEVLLVCTPSPSVELDTFFVAIVASTRRKFFGMKLEWLRYFTLELGRELNSTARRYCVCEWKSPHPRPDRESYGAIPSPDIELFLRAIEIQVRSKSDNVQGALNASGDVAGGVVEYPGGQNLLIANENTDMNSMVYSIAYVFTQDLKSEDRLIFCRWAGLPDHEWSPFHRDLCALAIMHYLCDAKESGTPVPEAVQVVAPHLTKDGLPPLGRPLTAQVSSMFNRMFGA